MFPQNAYNLIAEVEESKVTQLETILKDVNEDVEDNPYFNFYKIKTLHFGRFVILGKREVDQGNYPVYLAFESNYDGPLEEHLKDILDHTERENGFDRIFGFCKDFPQGNTTDEARLAFMKRNSRYHSYFYRGTWGRTVVQIREEESVRQKIQQALGSNGPENTDGRGVFEFLKSQVTPSTYKTIHPPRLIVLILLGLLLLPFLLVLLLVALVLFFILRRRESKEAQMESVYDPNPETETLKRMEDRIIQNQMTHLVELKGGFVRRWWLKLVLSAIQTLGVFYFNKGKLGGIPSIHFARWILIDKGKRLLFYSNYDGSWENYLGEFIDKASIGLTGVWCNTVLFPRSKNLHQKGARDEKRFKSWTRKYQIPTQVWYSAYKYLTVENINRNTEINYGLQRKDKMTDQELKDWLLKL